jgi:DNA repair protein RadD
VLEFRFNITISQRRRKMELRPYQRKVIDDLRRAYGQGKRAPLLFLPTGGGKTICFAEIARGAEAKGGKVLVVVHRRELLNQAVDKLRAAGLFPGIISAGLTMQLDLPTQVASVQTITRRFDKIKAFEPSLIILDEAHHAQEGNAWGEVFKNWPNARRLGVTATPVRSDGGGLDDFFDTLVLGPSVHELTEQGYLSPTELYAPPQVVDMKGVRKQCGDYAKKDLDDRMDKKTVTGDAVAHYARICPRMPALAFCVSVGHAEHVAGEFASAGFRAASIDGDMDQGLRAERIKMLGDGRLDVLTSCDVVSEGTDIPIVGAAILLRPTMSEGLFLQQVGRVLRPAPGKTKAVILDHVGNIARHGMPCADRQWTLEGAGKEGGKKKAEGPPPPVTCEKCFRQILRPAPPKCPYCGAEMKKTDRMSTLEAVQGELKRIEEAEKIAAKNKARNEQNSARTMEDLITLAKIRGYRNPHAWAAYVYRNSWRKNQ